MKAGPPLFQVSQGRVVRVVYLTRMIRAVIVDDDANNRAYLLELLRTQADVEVVGEAGNIAQAAEQIGAMRPELLFLDVEMPGGSGFDLLKQLGTWSFEVVFTTGFQRYAIQAIRFSALDYLLKPVQPDELEATLARFRQRHPQADRSTLQQQFLSNLGQADERGMKLSLTHGDRTYFIAPMEIGHCTADDNYTVLHTTDGRRFISARTLKDYEDMLAPLGFLRIHRSSLANRAQIDHVADDRVVLKNGVQLEISRRKKDDVLRALAAG